MGSPAYTEQSLGKRGSVVLASGQSNSSVTGGSFVCLVAGPSGATCSTLTVSNKDNDDYLEDVALPAGYTTFGNITAVTVSSGIVELYKS